MQTTPKNLLKLGRLTPAQLLSLAMTVASRMSGNANYPAPFPTLVTIATDITNLSAAIVARGTKRNKGTAANTVNLASAVATMRQDLVQLANYVTNTTPYDKDALITTGFVIKGKKHKSKTLQTARNFTAKQSRSINRDQIKLAWKKGLGGVKANENKMWDVRFNVVPNFETSVLLTQSTQGNRIVNKNEMVDTGLALTNGQQVYFWVIGRNGKGASVTSDVATGRFVDLGS